MGNNLRCDKIKGNGRNPPDIQMTIYQAIESREPSVAAWDSDSDNDENNNGASNNKSEIESDSRDESQSQSQSQCSPSSSNSGRAVGIRFDELTHSSLDTTSHYVISSSDVSSSKSSDVSSSKSRDVSSSKSSDVISSSSYMQDSRDTKNDRIFSIVKRINKDNNYYSAENNSNDDRNKENSDSDYGNSDNSNISNIRNTKNDFIGKSKSELNIDFIGNSDGDLTTTAPNIGHKDLMGNIKNRKKIDETYESDSSTTSSSNDSDSDSDSDDVFDLQKAFAVDNITVSTQSTYDSNVIFFSPQSRRV